MLLPEKILNQHVVALGKTRSGKSSKLRLIVESLLDAEKPVCIIDPKGDWWGLKSSATGKSAGHPVVIFGGEHADVPLNEHTGAQVAEMVATGNRPCIIDLGGWTVGARTRFFIDFASALFKHSKGVRHLVIDECHNFAPQGKILSVQAGEMVHWSNRLAAEGAGKGILLIAASQRPQKVHKDFLTCFETLIACKVIHKLDRGAIKDWIDGCADPDLGRQVLTELAGMKKNEAWVWSPEVEFGPEKVSFPMFKTYDSFKAQVHDVGPLKGWASVELKEISTQFDSLIREAEANDPKKLQQEIVRFKREIERLKKSPQGPAGPTEDEIQARIDATVAEAQQLVPDNFLDGNNELILVNMTDYARRASRDIASIEKLIVEIRESISQPPPKAETKTRKLFVTPKHLVKMDPVPELEKNGDHTKEQVNRAAENSDSLTGPERRILNAVAWLESVGIEQPKNPAIAFIAGYSAKGSAYKGPRSSLKGKDLINYPATNTVELTEAGRRLANYPDNILSNSDLQSRILEKLSGPQKRILIPLLDNYPIPLSNEELSSLSGYSMDGSAYKGPRSALKTLGFIDYPKTGYVVARPILFPFN